MVWPAISRSGDASFLELGSMDDRYFMRRALSLAARGQGYVAPNPMVGALVVQSGKVVGRGYHRAVGQPHAEVEALEDAGPASRGATLYVTLEPCNHTGRTPPCTQKILQAGIRRVVMAMRDPNPHVDGGGTDFLRRQGLQVTCGVCEAQARRLNEVFVKYVTTGRPFVMLKCAATLDGQIATRSGDARWISGEASRRYVHELRHMADAILVGIGTVLADDPSLTTRLEGGVHGRPGRDPRRIILDTHLSIPETARVLRQASDSDTLIVVGPGVSAEKRARLTATGAGIIESPLKDGWVDLQALMEQLAQRSITSLLIEGGGRVCASALKAGVVDKIFFFFAPKLLGGSDGVPICHGPGVALMRDALPVKDMTVKRFGDDVLIEGYL